MEGEVCKIVRYKAQNMCNDEGRRRCLKVKRFVVMTAGGHGLTFSNVSRANKNYGGFQVKVERGSGQIQNLAKVHMCHEHVS
jgi:hypothetical protein